MDEPKLSPFMLIVYDDEEDEANVYVCHPSSETGGHPFSRELLWIGPKAEAVPWATDYAKGNGIRSIKS